MNCPRMAHAVLTSDDAGRLQRRSIDYVISFPIHVALPSCSMSSYTHTDTHTHTGVEIQGGADDALSLIRRHHQ